MEIRPILMEDENTGKKVYVRMVAVDDLIDLIDEKMGVFKSKFIEESDTWLLLEAIEVALKIKLLTSNSNDKVTEE